MVAGIVLLPLPGPGTLIIVAGLRILVPYYRWVAVSYDRIRDEAMAAARAGVATWPRIAASTAGILWLAALSGMYAANIAIPQMSFIGVTIGPSLPFQSTAVVVGLFLSSIAAAAVTIYSIARFRPRY